MDLSGSVLNLFYIYLGSFIAWMGRVGGHFFGIWKVDWVYHWNGNGDMGWPHRYGTPVK